MITTLRAMMATRPVRLAAATALVGIGLGILAELVEQLRSDVADTAALLATTGASAGSRARSGLCPGCGICDEPTSPAYPAEEDLTPLHTMPPNGFESSMAALHDPE